MEKMVVDETSIRTTGGKGEGSVKKLISRMSVGGRLTLDAK
jgi:hypothetical protein